MAFQIRQIDRTANGREITRERRLDKDRLTLGRSAENDLHLPDLALDLFHAEIALTSRGRIAVRTLSALGFTLDGALHQSVQIACRDGGELGFGSYQLTISAGDDGSCIITIRQIGGAGSALENRRDFSLGRVLPGKRRMAWASALTILVLFLIIPIATHVLHQSNSKIPVVGDSSWSPGKLSLDHHALEQKCETCHVQGFAAVRDEVCSSCHKDIHDHAATDRHSAADRLAKARAEPGLGGSFLRAVAKGFGKPGPGACVDCHLQHEGVTPMPMSPQKFCAECHGSLSDRLRDTKLGNASDFGSAHPQFRPLVVTSAASRSLSRLSLDRPVAEDNGLTFPHKLHLDKQGGATRMAISLGSARGYGSQLDCGNCHRKTEDGVRFQPIIMERDCAACHSLAYDRVGSTVRTLHHGDVDQAIVDVSSRPAARPATGPAVNGRRRPGAFDLGGTYYNNFSSPPVGSGAAGLAFARGGICSECHTPVMQGGKFGVIPVTLRNRFMDHGWFDHRPHRQTTCATCHAAAGSTRSSDVLLPPIATCRTCHLGADSTKAKVPSGCAMCHSYHLPSFISDKSRHSSKQAAGKPLREGG